MDSEGPPNGSPFGTAESQEQSAPRSRRARLRDWWARYNTHALVVGVVAAIVGAVVPLVVTGVWHSVAEKKPAPCPGAGCAGKQPGNCSVDAATYAPIAHNDASLQVRYSKRCGAAWGRILRGEPGDVVTITTDGEQAERGLIRYDHDAFTPMVTVTRSSSITVCAEPTTVADRSGIWEAYCIKITGKGLEKIYRDKEQGGA